MDFDLNRSIAPPTVPSKGSCTGDMFAYIIPVVFSKQGGRDLLSNLFSIGCARCLLAPRLFELFAKSHNLSQILTPPSLTSSQM